MGPPAEPTWCTMKLRPMMSPASRGSHHFEEHDVLYRNGYRKVGPIASATTTKKTNGLAMSKDMARVPRPPAEVGEGQHLGAAVTVGQPAEGHRRDGPRRSRTRIRRWLRWRGRSPLLNAIPTRCTLWNRAMPQEKRAGEQQQHRAVPQVGEGSFPSSRTGAGRRAGGVRIARADPPERGKPPRGAASRTPWRPRARL